MTTDRRPRAAPSRPKTAATPAAKRKIPLPPLPEFRMAGTKAKAIPEEPVPAPPRSAAAPPATSGVSAEESDQLLEALFGPDEASPAESPTRSRPSSRGAGTVRQESASKGAGAPRPWGSPADDAEPERTGAPGADVINDLVEEIERDLENEVTRLSLQTHNSLPAYRRTLPCSYVPAPPLATSREMAPDDAD